MTALSLLLEVLQYAPTAITLGVQVVDTIKRAIELWEKGAAATPEELAALAASISAERTKLAAMTAALDQDPS